MAKRFFVDKENISIEGENISVFGKEAHHINVLRHKIGDIIKVNEYVIEIVDINQTEIVGKIQSVEEEENISNIFISLYQSYVKSDKMEFIVQKAVELGANKVVPFLSKNCVVKLDEKDKIKKLERLNKISMEASKQCNRSDIANIEEILNIKEKDLFISKLNMNDINILAYEKSNNLLKNVLENIKEQNGNSMLKIGVIIGPEGGFDDTDLDILNNINNLYEVSLGKRILRAETASINLLSIINYVFEN